MAESRKVVKVFLASPGDLQSERRTAKAVVDEFNRLWADNLGHHVELVGWEDTVTGFGRPQALINRDLEQCELFIGMMWKRWGTPPDAASTYTSGFEEEFERSVSAKHKLGKPEIKLLFKALSEDTLRDPGPELAKVIAFKARIESERIVLYEQFSDQTDFEFKIRRCVTNYVQGLAAAEAQKVSDASQSSSSEDVTQAITKASPTAEPPLSADGGHFLRDLVQKSEASGDISNVEVARLRLVSSIVGRQGNDEGVLGVHDANLIFKARAHVELGHREMVGLVISGLAYFKSGNAPLWHWYAAVDGDDRNLLPVYSLVRGEKVSALAAMTLVGTPLTAKKALDRSDYLDAWFHETANDIRVAALEYLADWGGEPDLPVIKGEIDRANYATSSAALTAFVRINLKQSRQKAIEALYELQPNSISNKLLDEVFAKPQSLPTALLVRGLSHRCNELRLRVFNLLVERDQVPEELSHRFLADNFNKLRFSALKYLASKGRQFSPDEAKTVLIKPAEGGLLGAATGRDDVGEQFLEEFTDELLRRIPLEELQRLAAAENFFERSAYFALSDREFAKGGGTLRAQISDQFKSEFDQALVSYAERVGGVESDTYKKTKGLSDFVRKGRTRKALSIVCRNKMPQDLELVREALRREFVDYADEDVEYLRQFGEWDDIPILIKIVERPNYSRGLSLFSQMDDNRFDAVSRAIYSMGRDRVDELLQLTMNKRLLRHLICLTADSAFKKFNDALIWGLLRNEDDDVRRVAALKCVKCLQKNRLRRLLVEYLDTEIYYYNVVHWLDFGLSLSRDVTSRAAARELERVG